MKRSILFLAILGTITALVVFYVNRFSAQPSPNSSPIVALPSSLSETAPSTHHDPLAREQHAQLPQTASTQAALTSPENLAFAASLERLCSPHSTYSERLAAWKQIQDAGRLQDAANELTQRMNSDTNNAVYPTALGQAYLKLCATTTDVRSQGIWAMEADQAFDTALNLDPSNWDARFTKAVAMSYWPDNLNKGPEVINQFNTLLQQQAQEAPQPQFAATYDWLGLEYQKTGQPDLARQTWQQGAALFPNYPSLANHLAGLPPSGQ